MLCGFFRKGVCVFGILFSCALNIRGNTYADYLLKVKPISSLYIEINDRSLNKMPPEYSSYLAELLSSRLAERCDDLQFNTRSSQLIVKLSLNGELSPQSYRITHKNRVTRIEGGDPAGLLYGVGRFLHTSGFDAGRFYPSAWTGYSVPHSSLRGVYFATHFFNWYQMAPADELQRYIEDLSLWGYNAIMVACPFINLTGFDDPEMARLVNKLDTLLGAARRVEMRTGLLFCPNADFQRPKIEFAATPNPDPLKCRGNHGNNICPNKPGATEYILTNVRRFHAMISARQKIDLIGLWPYDEGGCGCEQCYPWGIGGYLPLGEKIGRLIRAESPDTEIVLSTWMYDSPQEGEWKYLSEYCASGKGAWIDYILADNHDDFPRYPLDNPVPGNLPLLNFPEISMWGLMPWGGYGANPLPARFNRLWKQVQNKVVGGFPYSEGIFDDINKVTVSQFYWDPDADIQQTESMYIGYEYGVRCMDQVLSLISGIEQNHTTYEESKKFDLSVAQRVWNEAQQVDSMLSDPQKQAWRWRVLYLRAQLDLIRYNFLATLPLSELSSREIRERVQDALNQNFQAIEALRELVKINHNLSLKENTCPQHLWVRSPLQE